MKKTTRLRTQLTLLMALLVLLQSLALLMALSISRVFTLLDSEAFRLFNNTTTTRMQSFNSAVGNLVGNMADETVELNQKLRALAKESDVAPAAIFQNDEVYEACAVLGSDSLVHLLQNNNITGAFFLLNGSNANKGDESAHSAVYVRNTAPGNPGTENYQLEVGPTSIAQDSKLSTSIRWNLDMHLDTQKDELRAFYDKPVWAATQYRNAEIERYGYWSTPSAILGDAQQAIYYTMPLIDEEGVAYGVLGIEISLAFLTQAYLPNTDLPYPNSFYAIAPVQADGEMTLDWTIPSGPVAQVYLVQGQSLRLRDVPSVSEMYQTPLDGLGEMYCSAQPLTMYSRNSPFVEDNWSLVGFVPQSVLHEGSTGVRSILIISLGLTTLVSIVAVFLLAYASTRKISGLSSYIKKLSPYQEVKFIRTGMREVDELMTAVETFNKSVMHASNTTSQILELTLLPIGGFEVTTDLDTVFLTEFSYTLMGKAPGTVVGRTEWEAFYGKLTSCPAEGYENIYQYQDPQQQEDGPRWLRILETPTATGCVGVLLDVTKDIEEHRRLAHELDYDALTRLYNRTAFKREAFNRIKQEPDKIGAMIFCDLDNLKYTNDTFGHDMGDRMIISAGEMFREFAALGGIVSRISGDEFAIYLHGFSSKEEARKVIHEQYRRNEAYTLETTDGEVQRIRSSSGLAWYPEDSDNVTDLLKLSDYAMYEAKHREKGSLFEFNKQSYNENAYLLENREAINRLLDEGLIRFAFQPIVDLKTGEIYAYEALMRPLLDNFKNPGEILSVAAAQSKLGQLERLVLVTAFSAIQENKDALNGKKVFINSIPSQILSEQDRLMLTRQYGHLFPQVVFEIIEAESDSPEKLEDKLAFVHDNNMMLAIDDFGSGYSNELRVLSVQPDIIKIDMALIQGIHADADKQNLVSNLISFCHQKGILVVAEGVEEGADLEEIIRLGVDLVQGYYIGMPDFSLLEIAPEIRGQICAMYASYANGGK